MFLQIGDNKAIAIKHIVTVYLGESRIHVEFDVQDGDQPLKHYYEGDDYTAFMNWWAHKAEVYKI